MMRQLPRKSSVTDCEPWYWGETDRQGVGRREREGRREDRREGECIHLLLLKNTKKGNY